MKINREDFLQKLHCAEPGVSKKETIRQSSCFIFRKGRLYSMSQEIACSVASGLPEDVDATLNADTLLSLVKALTQEELDLEFSEVLRIKAIGYKSKLALEAESVLPIDSVERPGKWSKLAPGFEEAVSVTCGCTAKSDREAPFLQQVVHITPDFLESSDHSRFVRYAVKTFVKQNVLVRGSTLAAIAQLGMTKGCETGNWLHFWNPVGLRLSVRKFREEYPDLSDFLKKRGERLLLPRVLKEVMARAAILDTEKVQVTINDNKLEVLAFGQGGESCEEVEVLYAGEQVRFSSSPKLLTESLKHGSEVEVLKGMLRLDAGRYIYCVGLDAV